MARLIFKTLFQIFLTYWPSTGSANRNALFIVARQAVQSASNIPPRVIHDASASRAIKVIRMVRVALPSKRNIFDDIEALLANWLSFALRLFFGETRAAEELFVVLRQRSSRFSGAAGIDTVALETVETPFGIQSTVSDLKGAIQIIIKGFAPGLRKVGELCDNLFMQHLTCAGEVTKVEILNQFYKFCEKKSYGKRAKV